MPLRCKIVSTITVDYADLERFIKEIYGQDYEIPSQEEKGNDCNLTYSLKVEPMSDWDERKLGEFCHGKNVSYALRVILQDLVNNEKILPGNYSIRISW